MLIKIENGQPVGAPILEDNFRQLHPSQVFPLVLTPAIVDPYGYGMYDFTQVPEVGPYQKLVEDTPAIDQYGIWRQVWSVVDLEGAELIEKVAAIKLARWNEIKSLRDTKIQLGGFPAAGKWFHSDTLSRSQHLGMVISGANLPQIPWKTMDGSYMTTTPTLVQQIFAAAFSQDTALFAYADTLKAQMEASNDPVAFDITVGWPTTYGDV